MEQLDELNRIVDLYNDYKSTQETLDGWYGHDGQVGRAGDRLAAIEAWRKWAHGNRLDSSELHTVAQWAPHVEDRLAQLFDSALASHGVDPGSAALSQPSELDLAIEK